MSRKLFEAVNKAAEELDLIYAPDSASWDLMRSLAKVIEKQERERCAVVCEKLGLLEAAAKIRGE
jgi:hypothetical protein